MLAVVNAQIFCFLRILVPFVYLLGMKKYQSIHLFSNHIAFTLNATLMTERDLESKSRLVCRRWNCCKSCSSKDIPAQTPQLSNWNEVQFLSVQSIHEVIMSDDYSIKISLESKVWPYFGRLFFVPPSLLRYTHNKTDAFWPRQFCLLSFLLRSYSCLAICTCYNQIFMFYWPMLTKVQQLLQCWNDISARN